MSSIWDTKFIVVDVETTGPDAKKNRITDIACVSLFNGEIFSEYNSLVNPHQSIPPFIVKMTGIRYDMVMNAPESKEISKRVLEIFRDPSSIFVAHNVKFDWNFINQTLQRNKLPELNNSMLCTLKLAKRLLGHNIKKNVGSLAEYFEINIKNRHRALGDAQATAKFLVKLLEIAEEEHSVSDIDELLKFQNKQLKHFYAPTPTVKRIENKLDILPDLPGVYRFLDKNENILYIGKAKSLKERVRSYFHNETFTSKKIAKMLKLIYNIKWELTETELSALILESKRIKKFKPPFNTVDKKYKQYPFIKLTTNEDFPRIEISYTVDDDGSEYFGPFSSIYSIENIIQTVQKKFNIRKCSKEIKPSSENKPCFYFHIEQCYSPCSDKISKELYSKEINKVRLYLSGYSDGIIQQLESKMISLSENMEFEKAEKIRRNIIELHRIFRRQMKVPTSINTNNLILIIPASATEKTLELFLIKTGRLSYQQTIGRLAPLNIVFENVHNAYFNGNHKSIKMSKEDIDELRILTSWINRQNGKGNYIYLDGKKENEVLTEIETTIRNISFDKESD